MVSDSNTEKDWNEVGVFKFFSCTPTVIEQFKISDTLSLLERKEKKRELGSKEGSGKCKNCKYDSKVHYGNPSNWVRHLKTKHKSKNFLLTLILPFHLVHL